LYENRQISIVEEKVHQHQLFKRESETNIFVEESGIKISIEESEAKIIVESYVKQEMLFENKESGNENKEIIEKEIETVFVATKNVIIPTNNVFMASCALESLSQIVLSEENSNPTFERSKEKEGEMMENYERKYSDVIEVEDKENIESKEEKREKKNKCDEKKIYERNLKEC
jgi:hypothetical protein